MPRAELTITLPDDLWIGRLTRRYPETALRVHNARTSGGVGIALVELTGETANAVIEELDAMDEVRAVDAFDRRSDRALIQLEVAFPMMLLPVEASAAPIRMPFDILDGVVTWEVVATHERLSNLADQLDLFGIPFEVERINTEVGLDRLLTGRQAHVVQAALKAGYYDSPRRCTLTELAESLDLAPSTCSETLHRAEERIIKRFNAEIGPHGHTASVG